MTGYILIVFGMVYLIKPDIFRRGIWLETSIAVRKMSARQYKVYMRVLGGVFIAIGIFLLVKK